MTNQEREEIIKDLKAALEYCQNNQVENLGLCYIFYYELKPLGRYGIQYLETDKRYDHDCFFWNKDYKDRLCFSHKKWYAPRIAWLKTHIAKLEKELL